MKERTRRGERLTELQKQERQRTEPEFELWQPSNERFKLFACTRRQHTFNVCDITGDCVCVSINQNRRGEEGTDGGAPSIAMR